MADCLSTKHENNRQGQRHMSPKFNGYRSIFTPRNTSISIF